jgi:hypothetical protein
VRWYGHARPVAQRVLEYKVEIHRGIFSGWQHVTNGTAIGHKHIDLLNSSILFAGSITLRLTITASAAPPIIALRAFNPC